MPNFELIETANTSYIRAVVLKGNKDIRIVKCKAKENKASLNKDWEVTFKGDQIGRVWVRTLPTFRMRYVPAIFVREGSISAMDLSNNLDFIPPLTMKENADMIKQKMAQAIAHGKFMKNIQFAVIVGLLGLVIVLAILNLTGVHISVSTSQMVTNTTQTLTPPPV